VKEQLEQIVLQMYRSGLDYSKAVREFQRMFLATALREANANQVKARNKTGHPSEHLATPNSRVGIGHQDTGWSPPPPSERARSCRTEERKRNALDNSTITLIALGESELFQERCSARFCQ
jgi:hypothetical protein